MTSSPPVPLAGIDADAVRSACADASLVSVILFVAIIALAAITFVCGRVRASLGRRSPSSAPVADGVGARRPLEATDDFREVQGMPNRSAAVLRRPGASLLSLPSALSDAASSASLSSSSWSSISPRALNIAARLNVDRRSPVPSGCALTERARLARAAKGGRGGNGGGGDGAGSGGDDATSGLNTVVTGVSLHAAAAAAAAEAAGMGNEADL